MLRDVSHARQRQSRCVLQPGRAAFRGYVGKLANGQPNRKAVPAICVELRPPEIINLLINSRSVMRNKGRNRFAVGLFAGTLPNVAAKRGNVGLEDTTASPLISQPGKQQTF